MDSCLTLAYCTVGELPWKKKGKNVFSSYEFYISKSCVYLKWKSWWRVGTCGQPAQKNRSARGGF